MNRLNLGLVILALFLLFAPANAQTSCVVEIADSLRARINEYFALAAFDEPGAEERFLGPLKESSNLADWDTGASQYFSQQEEYEWFARYNFVKKRLSILFKSSDASQSEVALRLSQLRAIEELFYQKYRLLVVDIAWRFRSDRAHGKQELISDCDYRLFQAISKFDCSRGFRFSTFVSRCALNELIDGQLRDEKRKIRESQPKDLEIIRSVCDPSANAFEFRLEDEEQMARIQDVMNRPGFLDSREQMVIKRHYGFDGEPETLASLARELGVSKERVRQLQSRALNKIRRELGIKM